MELISLFAGEAFSRIDPSNVLKTSKTNILLVISLSSALAILMIGLWPFSLHSVNAVTWLREESGLFFYDRGIAYGPVQIDNTAPKSFLRKDTAVSIELLLRPNSDVHKGFEYILCLYDEYGEVFALSQVKSLLNISKPKRARVDDNPYDWKWVGKCFSKGEKRFLAISSNKEDTTVYLNGKKVREYRNYSLALGRELSLSWRIVLGNDPSGKKPWTGEMFGIAIYDCPLTSGQVSEHFQRWEREGPSCVSNEDGLVALYPMDELAGKRIHNSLGKNFHLYIPSRFQTLKKNVLTGSWKTIGLNSAMKRDAFINILGFVPFGFFCLAYLESAEWLKGRSWRLRFVVLIAGACLSLVIELLQVYLPERHSSHVDLTLNVIGTGLGIGLVVAYGRLRSTLVSKP